MKYIVILFISLTLSVANAQDGGFSGDRVTYGGNIGLVFGTQTVIDVSPRVGYYVTDQFVPGLSATYKYFKIDDFSDNIYGGGLFARYFLSEELFLHTETEMTNVSTFFSTRDIIVSQGRKWINTTMVGGGYMSGVFSLTALYIINHDPDTSPYGSSPLVLQAGVMF